MAISIDWGNKVIYVPKEDKKSTVVEDKKETPTSLLTDFKNFANKKKVNLSETCKDKDKYLKFMMV